VRGEVRAERADLKAVRPRSRSGRGWGGVGGSGKWWSVCCWCGWLDWVRSVSLADDATLIPTAGARRGASARHSPAAGALRARGGRDGRAAGAYGGRDGRAAGPRRARWASGGRAAGAWRTPRRQVQDRKAQTWPRWVCGPAGWVAHCKAGVPPPPPLPSNAFMTTRRFQRKRPALYPPSVSTAAIVAGSKPRSKAPGSAASSRRVPPLPALTTRHPRECTTHRQLPCLGGEPLSACAITIFAAAACRQPTAQWCFSCVYVQTHNSCQKAP